MLEELQLLVEEAREVADLWRRRAEASYDRFDDEAGLICDDMLDDAEEWLRASRWVLSQAEEEVDGGRPRQFVELGATITEEAAAGATMDDLMIYIWATAGEPPEAEVMAVDAGEVAELKAVAEAAATEAEATEAEAVAEAEATTEVEAVAAAAAAESAAAVAEAAARATATAVAEAVVGAGAETLTWVRQGGGLRLATVAQELWLGGCGLGAVAWRPRRWKERQRIFDPGG